MTQRTLRIILITAATGVLIFVGVITYQIGHQIAKPTVQGTSDFPAVNLLSGEIDSDSKSLIEANLQLYTMGKFNPTTAYILASGYKKSPQPGGIVNVQFYITVPEVTSTYQMNVTPSLTSTPTVTIICAPKALQPKNSVGCYQPPNELSYVHTGVFYA